MSSPTSPTSTPPVVLPPGALDALPSLARSLSGSALKLMLVLLGESGPDDITRHVSDPELAQACGCKPNHLRRLYAELEGAGLAERVGWHSGRDGVRRRIRLYLTIQPPEEEERGRAYMRAGAHMEAGARIQDRGRASGRAGAHQGALPLRYERPEPPPTTPGRTMTLACAGPGASGLSRDSLHSSRPVSLPADADAPARPEPSETGTGRDDSFVPPPDSPDSPEPPTPGRRARLEADAGLPTDRGVRARWELLRRKAEAEEASGAGLPAAPPPRAVPPSVYAPARAPASGPVAAAVPASKPAKVSRDEGVPLTEVLELARSLAGDRPPPLRASVREAVVDRIVRRWRDPKPETRDHIAAAAELLTPDQFAALIREAERPEIRDPARWFARNSAGPMAVARRQNRRAS